MGAEGGLWDTLAHAGWSVWVAGGVVLAALYWLLKWLFTVLFLQGKGVSLITVPVSRMAGRIIEDKFAQKLADSKLLPKLYPPNDWEELNRFTGHVADRMRTYRELIATVQATFNGPSALSLRLAVRFFEPGFVTTFRTAEAGFRDLDRLDEELRALHREVHEAMERRTGADEAERERVERELEMVRLKVRHRAAARREDSKLPRLAIWVAERVRPKDRALRAEKKALAKRLGALRKSLKRERARTFERHHVEAARICLTLIEHDARFLRHLYFRFGLEMESLTFTVASGRVLELVAGERGGAAREALGLADLPEGVEAARGWLRADTDLRAHVGLGPESVLEGALEPWLRIKLLLGHVRLEGYDPHWVAHLPPPSEFGTAQAEYDHFPHQLAWLKRLPEGVMIGEGGIAEVRAPELHAAE